jgi:prepilin-type N-terminal cleavage/methylation domain-containing protein
MKGFSSRKTGQSGFALVELIVALVVFAVLASIAVPAVTSWYPTYQLRNAVRELQSNMQLVRLEAIRQNTNCTITFTANGYACSSPSKTINLSDYSHGGIQFQGPGGETFGFVGGTVTFSPTGMVSGATGGPGSGFAYLSNQNNSAFYRVGPGASTAGVIRSQQRVGGTWQ